MRSSLQGVFERHFDSFAKGKALHSRQLQAAHSIRSCYTAALGSHLNYCAAGHYQQQQFHACRHRSCPRCADGARQAWLDAELRRLLPCPHFHVVFTVPHELLGLWEFNRKEFGQVLFDCVRVTLLQMLGDPRHLGALPGLLLSLHTWGRTLSHHPHIHALVTAGGVNAKGQWCATREDFLLPLVPLQKLFSGKLIANLRESLPKLALPPNSSREHWHVVLNALYRKHWNIQINPPYAHGKGVAIYLARYAKGGPLPKDREIQLSASHVSFGYTDHRDHRTKVQRLAVPEFIERILWHAPPKGAHTVRHAGLYASARKRTHARAQIALTCPAAKPVSQSGASFAHLATPQQVAPQLACPKCAAPLLRARLPPAAEPRSEISLSRVANTGSPQSTPSALGPTRRSNGHATGGPPRPYGGSLRSFSASSPGRAPRSAPLN